MKKFIHSGKLGDIIYSLPVIRDMGGGILYMDDWEKMTKLKVTPAVVQSIKPLLSYQGYISDVVYADRQTRPKDLDLIDLNKWRYVPWESLSSPVIIGKAYQSQGMDIPEVIKPWLFCPPIQTEKIVVARSSRYHQDRDTWCQILCCHRKQLLFVGLKEEHVHFENEIGEIEYYPTPDIWTLAQVISGCIKFIGNQSFPLSLALGLGKRCLIEDWLPSPDCCIMDSCRFSVPSEVEEFLK